MKDPGKPFVPQLGPRTEKRDTFTRLLAKGADETRLYELAIDMLADILQHSVFADDELAKERTVVLQEIGEVNDTPDDIIFDHLQSVAFPGQAIGRTILGPPERVSTFAREDLLRFIDAHYGAPRRRGLHREGREGVHHQFRHRHHHGAGRRGADRASHLSGPVPRLDDPELRARPLAAFPQLVQQVLEAGHDDASMKLAAILAAGAIAAATVQTSDLRTRAEISNYEETSTYADVTRVIDGLVATSPLVHAESFGTSEEGRALPLVVISDPKVTTPQAARRLGRSIVLVQANIHAGEVEGLFTAWTWLPYLVGRRGSDGSRYEGRFGPLRHGWRLARWGLRRMNDKT